MSSYGLKISYAFVKNSVWIRLLFASIIIVISIFFILYSIKVKKSNIVCAFLEEIILIKFYVASYEISQEIYKFKHFIHTIDMSI